MERYRLFIGQNVDGRPAWSYDDVAAQAADALAAQGFHGATFYSAVEVWKGERERSTVAELLSSDDDDIAHRRLRDAARDIADRLSLREVLVTHETVRAGFVEAAPASASWAGPGASASVENVNAERDIDALLDILASPPRDSWAGPGA